MASSSVPARASIAPGLAVARDDGHPLLAVAVDTLRQGLLVFDAAGHVLSANAAARRVIEQYPGLSLQPSPEPPHERLRLRIQPGPLQLRFDAAVRACALDGDAPTFEAATSRRTSASRTLVLARADGQPALVLQLSSLALPAGAGRPNPLVLGTIVDRSVAPRVALAMLRDLFGLTESEARVAEAYLRVDTVKDVAEQLGVSVNTVKTHMAATYLKTGCTRQAQLVRLLMTLAEMSENGSPG